MEVRMTLVMHGLPWRDILHRAEARHVAVTYHRFVLSPTSSGDIVPLLQKCPCRGKDAAAESCLARAS